MDTDFEILTSRSNETGLKSAEIYFNKQFIALITLQEPDSFEVRFPSNQFEEEIILRCMDLSSLLEAIEAAKSILIANEEQAA